MQAELTAKDGEVEQAEAGVLVDQLAQVLVLLNGTVPVELVSPAELGSQLHPLAVDLADSDQVASASVLVGQQVVGNFREQVG